MLRRTVCLTAFALSVTSLPAQILGARPLAQAAGNKPTATVSIGAVASSPAVATTFTVTPAVLSRRDAIWDSAPLPKLVVTFTKGAGIEINMDRLAEWRRLEMPEFGASWVYPLAPAVRMGINYVTGGAAHNLLAGSAWGSVASTLHRDPKDSVRVVVNDDSTTNSGMVRLLGFRTRLYEWESTPAAPGPDATPLRQIVVAVGDDTHAYIFSLEGPSQQVKSLAEKFAGVVTSFDPAK